jgi:ABC-type transport system involved in multi-copper enzyme maturation permease subunit
MININTIVTIARLTLRETQRRRVLWMGLIMGFGFLLVYGLGFHFVYAELEAAGDFDDLVFLPMFLSLAGLYATNFLVIMVSLLISVGAISGEIESHTIDALITKPIRRAEVILGKWFGYAILIFFFILLLPGGVMLIVYLRSGFYLQNIIPALSLMFLEGMVSLAVALFGGTRLSTLANAAMAFMLYGVAFVGSWIEQIGALLRNETAVDIGIFTSLLNPADSLWRKATALLEPNVVLGDNFAGPFAATSQPSDAMILYAVLYAAVFLLLALYNFSRRDF